MTPNLSAQFRRPALDLTAGLHGYRIAFIGGVTFDAVDDAADNTGRTLWFSTLAEAGAAYRAAKLAADRLDAIFRAGART